jgi:hypothetical protein
MQRMLFSLPNKEASQNDPRRDGDTRDGKQMTETIWVRKGPQE